MKIGLATLFAIGLVVCASVLTGITKLNFVWPMIVIVGICYLWSKYQQVVWYQEAKSIYMAKFEELKKMSFLEVNGYVDFIYPIP
jgi:hypothetical protein